ncbi:MAG: hypothetical protein FJ115_07405 [Deltaproteobacteria bacterium]|nr:hypothetical protein [Deltaproteobacteria bacterium]MBM4323368.1 hypothetical protein [Deltaproteobacteria bacterium]
MNSSRPEYVFIVIIGFLAVLFFLIGRISGWSTLANFYRFSGGFIGQQWRFQSAQLRWYIGYNNCLTIGANESGLFLSVFFLLRIGHPSLFIPWGDVNVTMKKGTWGKYAELRFRQAPAIPFRMSGKLSEKIAGVAGRMWPGESR